MEAENTLRDLDMWKLPVDPLRIAKEEGIELAPSHYGPRFDARIEYFREFDRYAIYYQAPGTFRSPGRVNFSLAHELGHYYLPDHRERLRKGSRHNSASDYNSKSTTEREADRFAANLLMPQELFVRHVNEQHSGFCTLKNLCFMAEQLGTSITSTAARYCDLSIDATIAVVSKQRIIEWSRAADDMKRFGTWYVESGTQIPDGSKTALLYDGLEAGGTDGFIEGNVDAHTWFKWPKRDDLWEEAMVLGNRVLTYIAATNF
jgi:hypothetical protein